MCVNANTQLHLNEGTIYILKTIIRISTDKNGSFVTNFVICIIAR